jgi:hypothetical protein
MDPFAQHSSREEAAVGCGEGLGGMFPTNHPSTPHPRMRGRGAGFTPTALALVGGGRSYGKLFLVSVEGTGSCGD